MTSGQPIVTHKYEMSTELYQKSIADFSGLHYSRPEAYGKIRNREMLGLLVWYGSIAFFLWVAFKAWNPVVLFLFGAILAVMYITAPGRYARQAQKVIRNQMKRGGLPEVSGPVTVQLFEDSFQADSTVTSTKLPWSSVVDVLSDPKIICVYHTPEEAILIPRESFDREEDFQRMATVAASLWRDSHALPSP